ncbi:MAG: type IV pili methyl-accepting chemotaxis transducer N-terminal domain-containing protein [Betaproteobacteria bacterium]|nr:type IV pili methyl-accepting chemotaxis transducer N-terminal domain-containing protein [Betaproteobacteria bacterium]
MKIDRRFLAESLVVRLGMALGAIVALALAATISATVFTELSTGKAAAINLAGSLRMQSYWITVQVLRSGDIGRAPAELQRAIAEFESRLNSPLLIGGLPSDSDNPTRRSYERVAAVWSNTLKPAVARAVTEGASARDAFVARMATYVLDVDRLVYLLEHDLEQRIQTLRMIQGGALFAIIVVMFISLYLMHAQVIVPLADLLACARRVRVGDFAVRAQHAGKDELGQLGQSFNYMVADLSRSYATLEARVKEKTEQLARSNVSLEVLYNTTRTLAENPLTQATLDVLMRDIERAIGLKAGVICAREANDRRGYPIALNADCERAGAWCQQERCGECVCQSEARVRIVGSSAERMVSVPLSEGGKPYGVMLLQLPPGMELDEWKTKLLESIGHHVGAALATAKRTDERRRIVLLEERSVIARELHDSLAQSLSYLKIQVTRLKSHLERETGRERTAEVVEELKVGLNNAYRQLRELLTTFRLRMDGRGLSAALRDTVDEFSQRTELDFRLHDQLRGHELDSSEQIHVLQVVREALTNVEHHAHARHVDVRLSIETGRLRVTVEDDGVGIRDGEPPMHHYGLAIMRDRAATLGGTLKVSRRSEGGTRVDLEFSPRGPFQATGRLTEEAA